jgi:hypothetical protein
VRERLQAHNRGFDGQLKAQVRDGKVAELQLSADDITDLTPLRPLVGLQSLICTGSAPGKGRLSDLRPLRGLPLGVLDVSSTQVADLTPLHGMPLLFLGIANTSVRSLTPLEGMPLMVLHCGAIPARDIRPLRGLPLTLLDAAGMTIDDLTPLRGMKLEALWAPVKLERDADILRSMKFLKVLNDRPVAELLGPTNPPREPSKEPAPGVVKLPAPEAGGAVPRPSAWFIGKVVRVTPSETKFSLELTQSIVVLNPWHAAWLAEHQLKLLHASRIRSPIERIRAMQEQAFWIAHHQALLYERREERQTIEIQGTPDVRVRVSVRPPFYDDKGKLRPPTPKEEADLKGTEGLPGYAASFPEVQPGRVVKVWLTQVDPGKFRVPENAPTKEKPALPPLRAVVVLVQSGSP